jgi:hypothetical protein
MDKVPSHFCNPIGLIVRIVKLHCSGRIMHFGWVLAELAKRGFMAEVGGKRRLLQPERLLQQWVEAYARTLRPRLLLGRFHTDVLDWHKTIDPGKYGLLLGGEPAAARLTHHLRPGTVTLYGPKLNASSTGSAARADPWQRVDQAFWKLTTGIH